MQQDYDMDSVSSMPSENATLALLQAENAALRAELHALRDNKTQQMLHPKPASIGICHLFRLPREIRDAIYKLCVVPGTVFISRPDHIPFLRGLDMRYTEGRRGTQAIESQLFLVNREIRSEVLEVFLSMNQFVISAPIVDERSKHPHPITSRIPGHRDHPLLLTRHLRSISISLNSVETLPNEIMRKHVHITCDSYDYTDDGTREDDAELQEYDSSLMTLHHDDLTQRLTSRFSATLEQLFAFSSRLRHIQINLEATVCPLGCHRLVRHLFDSCAGRLKAYFARRDGDEDGDNYNDGHDALEALDFLGTVSDEERDAIRSAFPYRIQKKITFYGAYYGPACGFEAIDEELTVKF
jgi:hypothetical protein